MPITILSPYSGKPVKVRDQDVGRAIRDEERRIFYIVEGTDGAGHYASMTRKGSEKDEQRYRKLADGSATLDQQAATNVQQAHDATGTKRSNPVGMLLLIVVLLALAGAAYVYFVRPVLVPGLKKSPTQTTPPQSPEGTDPPSNDPQTPTSQHDPHRPAIYLVESPLAPEPMPTPYAVYRHPDSLSVRPATKPNIDLIGLPQPLPKPAEPTQGEAGKGGGEDAPAPPEGAPELPEDAAEPSETEPTAIPTWEPEPATGAADRAADDAAQPGDPLAGFRVMASGLRYREIEAGEEDAPRARAGHYVAVRYAAYTMAGHALIDDAEHTFILAAGQAIRALDEGLAGVHAGGQRVLFVPKGHSLTGRLPGIEELPEGPYLLDVQLQSVRPGVSVIVEEAGEGGFAMPGDRLTLAYTATVEGEAEPFDSSAARGRPLVLTLGQGGLIPGLAFGIAGVQLGETRLLTIPPYLAYGDRGAIGGLIPPGAVLTYRVTVVGLERAEEEDEGEE